MLTRMQMGKLKVFKHLNDWFEEFRLYHRKDGKVVKEGDDLMAATRYGIMMLRFASTKAVYDKFRHLSSTSE
jgi:Terminase RNaseH-like domain